MCAQLAADILELTGRFGSAFRISQAIEVLRCGTGCVKKGSAPNMLLE